MKRLAFIINVPAFFLSHRLPIALAAKRAGWHVDLITGQSSSASMEADSLRSLDSFAIAHYSAPFKATGTNPMRHVRVSVTADAPTVFWRFLQQGQEGRVPLRVQAAAGRLGIPSHEQVHRRRDAHGLDRVRSTP